MAESIPIEHADGHAGHDDHHEQTFAEKYIIPLDHKMISMQYLFTGIFMALIGGFFAYAFRMQLAWLGSGFPGRLQLARHESRHDHDLLGRDARSDRGLWQLFDPADDRRG